VCRKIRLQLSVVCLVYVLKSGAKSSIAPSLFFHDLSELISIEAMKRLHLFLISLAILEPRFPPSEHSLDSKIAYRSRHPISTPRGVKICLEAFRPVHHSDELPVLRVRTGTEQWPLFRTFYSFVPSCLRFFGWKSAVKIAHGLRYPHYSGKLRKFFSCQRRSQVAQKLKGGMDSFGNFGFSWNSRCGVCLLVGFLICDLSIVLKT